MIIDLLNRIFKSTLYIKISRNLVSVRLVEKGKEIEENPIVGVNRKNRVIAVGEEANSYEHRNIKGYRVVNGFDHPRTIIGQFDMAEAALRYLVKRVVSSGLIFRPIIIMHPTDRYEGGLSQIELRAIKDIGSSVGGREVHVWLGRELTDKEITKKQFPEYEGEFV